MLVIGQIVISIILIILVLIQQQGEGLGALFGGGGGGGTSYHTRRGLEKIIFWATIVSAIIFATLAILNLFIT